MDFAHTSILAAAIFAVAMLYATVGHAGASGYLACMALVGVVPDVMKPTALMLNIVVAVIAGWKYFRAGYFRWRTLWPFLVTSVPWAFYGGSMHLPDFYYKKMIGAVLVYAAVRLALTAGRKDDRPVAAPPILPGLAIGAVLGFASGLTGVGGGIFLSPILLFANWSDPRLASGVAAVFILLNSIAGLAGIVAREGNLFSVVPMDVLWWAPCAAAGGWLGAQFGSRKLAGAAIRRFLAAIVGIAALKMLFT